MLDFPQPPADARRHRTDGVYARVLDLQFRAIVEFLAVQDIQPDHVVVLDIDEVVINNLPQIHPTFSDFNDTTAIPGSHHLVAALQSRSIPYAFITGRPNILRDHTLIQLDSVGLNCPVVLDMYPGLDQSRVANFKADARARLATRHTILCTIGDQLTDLQGPHLGTPFLIWNPFYLVT